MGTVGRNDPCPCGSGKKFKKCCMAAHHDKVDATLKTLPDEMQAALKSKTMHTVTLGGHTASWPADRFVVLHTTHDLKMPSSHSFAKTGPVKSREDFRSAVREGIRLGLEDLVGLVGMEDWEERFERCLHVALSEDHLPDVNYEDIVREIWETLHEVKGPFDPAETVILLNPSHEKWGFVILPLHFEKALEETLQETAALLSKTEDLPIETRLGMITLSRALDKMTYMSKYEEVLGPMEFGSTAFRTMAETVAIPAVNAFEAAHPDFAPPTSIEEALEVWVPIVKNALEGWCITELAVKLGLNRVQPFTGKQKRLAKESAIAAAREAIGLDNFPAFSVSLDDMVLISAYVTQYLMQRFEQVPMLWLVDNPSYPVFEVIGAAYDKTNDDEVIKAMQDIFTESKVTRYVQIAEAWVRDENGVRTGEEMVCIHAKDNDKEVAAILTTIREGGAPYLSNWRTGPNALKFLKEGGPLFGKVRIYPPARPVGFGIDKQTGKTVPVTADQFAMIMGAPGADIEGFMQYMQEEHPEEFERVPFEGTLEEVRQQVEADARKLVKSGPGAIDAWFSARRGKFNN